MNTLNYLLEWANISLGPHEKCEGDITIGVRERDKESDVNIVS